LKEGLPPTCTAAGCDQPRERFAIFCDRHLRLSLRNAGFEVNLKPPTPARLAAMARGDAVRKVRRCRRAANAGAISFDEMDGELDILLIYWLVRDDHGEQRLAAIVNELSPDEVMRLLPLVRSGAGRERLLSPRPEPGPELDALMRKADDARTTVVAALSSRAT
jgi:hypothetical protein